MTPTQKQQLQSAIDTAIAERTPLFAIRVKMENFPTDEIIINDLENFESKMGYWDQTYTDNLVHKHSNKISIVAWASGDTYEEIGERI